MQLSRSERLFQEKQRHQERVMRKQLVRILNPVEGGKTHLKFEAARKHCEAGTAEWRNDRTAILFVGHKHALAIKSAEASSAVHATMGHPGQRIPVVRMRELFAPSPRRNFAWEKATNHRTQPVIGPFGESAAERRVRAMAARAATAGNESRVLLGK
jgi:hypothetical protein